MGEGGALLNVRYSVPSVTLPPVPLFSIPGRKRPGSRARFTRAHPPERSRTCRGSISPSERIRCGGNSPAGGRCCPRAVKTMPALRARPLRSYVSAALFSERERARRQYLPPADVPPPASSGSSRADTSPSAPRPSLLLSLRYPRSGSPWR